MCFVKSFWNASGQSMSISEAMWTVFRRNGCNLSLIHISTKAAEVFDQPAAHKPLLDKLKAFLHTGTIEVRPRITGIHQNLQVCIPVVTGISG